MRTGVYHVPIVLVLDRSCGVLPEVRRGCLQRAAADSIRGQREIRQPDFHHAAERQRQPGALPAGAGLGRGQCHAGAAAACHR